MLPTHRKMCIISTLPITMSTRIDAFTRKPPIVLTEFTRIQVKNVQIFAGVTFINFSTWPKNIKFQVSDIKCNLQGLSSTIFASILTLL